MEIDSSLYRGFQFISQFRVSLVRSVKSPLGFGLGSFSIWKFSLACFLFKKLFWHVSHLKNAQFLGKALAIHI